MRSLRNTPGGVQRQGATLAMERCNVVQCRADKIPGRNSRNKESAGKREDGLPAAVVSQLRLDCFGLSRLTGQLFDRGKELAGPNRFGNVAIHARRKALLLVSF